MTAASRGQKTAFPTATSTVAELPQWGCPADPQPHLNHPRPTHVGTFGSSGLLAPKLRVRPTEAALPGVNSRKH
jgi:hypothetical protein